MQKKKKEKKSVSANFCFGPVAVLKREEGGVASAGDPVAHGQGSSDRGAQHLVRQPTCRNNPHLPRHLCTLYLVLPEFCVVNAAVEGDRKIHLASLFLDLFNAEQRGESGGRGQVRESRVRSRDDVGGGLRTGRGAD